MDHSKKTAVRIAELEEEVRLLDSKVVELYTLYAMSKKLSLATQFEEVFEITMEHIGRYLEFDDLCIMLLDETRNELVAAAVSTDSDWGSMRLNLGEGVTGKTAVTGRIRVVQDVLGCKDFLSHNGRKKSKGSFLCLPLKGYDVSVLGTLNVHKEESNGFNEKDLDVFTEVAEQLSVTLNKVLSFNNVVDRSNRDSLTGLYNRRYLFDYIDKEIDRAKRYHHFVSLLLLDIDNFKNFNDTNGHLAGDEALKAVARLLEDNKRKNDVTARYGGEEFIVVLPHLNKDSALEAGERFRQAIEEEDIEGEENQPGGNLTVTIGVATYPDDATNDVELINLADKAMYYGKIKCKNLVVPYESKLSLNN